MPKIPECSTVSCRILQYASKHAFLAIPTHNPLLYEHEGKKVTRKSM